MSATLDKPLLGRRIVVGVAGGIAAYKSAYLVRELVKRGAHVHVVMTPRAHEFVGETTFQALSGRPVFTELFDRAQENQIGHIRVADEADLVIVAPATASTIARMAAGLADEPLSAVFLATRAPVLLAPSMNVNMWENPITQRNVQQLVELRGVSLVGPGSGFLACRWIGPGRLAEPDHIAFAAEVMLTDPDLAGRHVVITSGPTREAVDPVRFLSNRSTGKMGVALARAAIARGARVTLVTGPSAIPAPPGCEVVPVVSAEDMRQATLSAAADADAAVLAAAVADYRPAQALATKVKKSSWGDAPSLRLERTGDILAELGRRRAGSGSSRPVIVGFAAESGDPEREARAKLDAKGADLMVGNDIGKSDAGFGSDDNRAVLVSAEGAVTTELDSKLALAHRIWSWVAARLEETGRP